MLYCHFPDYHMRALCLYLLCSLELQLPLPVFSCVIGFMLGSYTDVVVCEVYLFICLLCLETQKEIT